MVANHPTLWTTSSGLQAPSNTRPASASARLATAHLLGPGPLEQRFRRTGLVGRRGDEHAELVVREARVPLDRPEAARREDRVEDDPEDRGQRAEQNRHLE